jgi:hypothetical protein
MNTLPAEFRLDAPAFARRRATRTRAGRATLSMLHALMLIIVPESADAAALGLPATTARIGYAAGPAYVSIDQANSAANGAWAMTQSLIYTDWFIAGTRYWAALRYGQADLDGGVGKIGEQMTFYGARASVQRNVRLATHSAPWLGAGIDTSINRHSNRYTVDEDGYLADRYPSRTTTNVGLVLNATHDWAIGRAFHLSANLEQLFAASDSVRETTLTAAVLYRY